MSGLSRTYTLMTVSFATIVAARAHPGSAKTIAKCSYFYAHQSPAHLKELAEHGFNLGIAKVSPDPDDPFVDRRHLATIRRFASVAAANDIGFMPVLNWAGKREINFMQQRSRRLVTADGMRLSKTPCPNDPRHWKHILEARALAIADEVTDGLDGILLDPEMYKADIGRYPRSGCYCDSCWRKFIAGTDVNPPARIPAEKRGKWVRKNGYATLYRVHQKQLLTNLLTKTRKRLHREYPQLEFGFLHYTNLPFYQALAAGLGTPKTPVWIFTERTYATGYSKSRVDKVISRLKKADASALLLPGLWIGKWQPHELAAQAYHCAKNAAGYWLFTTYSLDRPREKLTGAYTIPASQQKYWRAVNHANDELNRLAKNPDYKTPLTLPEPKTIYPDIGKPDVNVPKLTPLRAEQAGMSAAKHPASADVPSSTYTDRPKSPPALTSPASRSATIAMDCRGPYFLLTARR